MDYRLTTILYILESRADKKTLNGFLIKPLLAAINLLYFLCINFLKNSTFYKTAVLKAVFFVRIAANAQADKLGSWNIVNFMYKPNQHFSAFAELQAHSQLFFKTFFYHE